MSLGTRKKDVCNITDKINVIKPNALEGEARSNSRNMKLLVAEMKQPSKTESREKYGR